jgi:hypothetical protein
MKRIRKKKKREKGKKGRRNRFFLIGKKGGGLFQGLYKKYLKNTFSGSNL